MIDILQAAEIEKDLLFLRLDGGTDTLEPVQNLIESRGNPNGIRPKDNCITAEREHLAQR